MLGATRRIVVALVVRQSVRLAVTGVVIGSMLALGMARFGAAHTRLPAFDGIALMGGQRSYWCPPRRRVCPVALVRRRWIRWRRCGTSSHPEAPATRDLL